MSYLLTHLLLVCLLGFPLLFSFSTRTNLHQCCGPYTPPNHVKLMNWINERGYWITVRMNTMNHSRGMKHGRDVSFSQYSVQGDNYIIMSERMHIHKHHSFATIQVVIHPTQNCVTELTTEKSNDSQWTWTIYYLFQCTECVVRKIVLELAS